MSLERYSIVAEADRLTYKFFSEGPKGTIKKAVIYQRLEKNVFNLAFGDWSEAEQKIDDTARSNNNDPLKILATVASTVIEFFNFYPDSIVKIEGSTPARTRLYQMNIQSNLYEISKQFVIFGLREGEWEFFEKRRNYESFLLIAR